VYSSSPYVFESTADHRHLVSEGEDYAPLCSTGDAQQQQLRQRLTKVYHKHKCKFKSKALPVQVYFRLQGYRSRVLLIESTTVPRSVTYLLFKGYLPPRTSDYTAYLLFKGYLLPRTSDYTAYCQVQAQELRTRTTLVTYLPVQE
jgi:hypothetical protein